MEKYILSVQQRTLFGKKLKKLRRENIVPANIFGKNIDSVAVQAKIVDFQKVFKKAKNTQLVYLQLGKDEYPVLTTEVQKDPVSNAIVHVDFRKVNLAEKVETQVPVEITGELSVVKSGEADMLLLAQEITIECLPAHIPEKITISIASLSGIGAEIKIKDLPVNKDYAYTEDPEKTVVQIVAAQKEEIKAPVAPVADAAATEGEGTPAAGTGEGATDAKSGKEEKPKADEKKK